MNSFRRCVLWLLVLLPASCSESLGSSAGEDPVEMFIESCSLGCIGGDDGAVVFCSLVNTHQNGDITLRFSKPIDPFSIHASTFQIVEAATGIPAEGQVMPDPTDDRALLFRPALHFDSSGIPVHGLRPNVAYWLRVHGRAQGDSGPFIRSRDGDLNQTRLDCTIVTDQGILDFVQGNPQVEVFADVVTSWDEDGEPLQVETGRRVPRNPMDLQGVHRNSPLRFVFADLMNPGTLANNSTGAAPFVRVEVDGDGVLATSHDRSPVPGQFQVYVDAARLETELVFRPAPGYPSAGSPGSDPDPGTTRFIVVTIPPTVTDLTGNGVGHEDGGGQLAFVQERLQFDSLTLPSPAGVGFEHPTGDPLGWADPWRTGAAWGGGVLEPGVGGGSGRLGELIVRSGQVVELSTDHQVFPLQERSSDVSGNRNANGQYPGEGQVEVVVRDGVFEFASLRVESGGRLVLRGENPARLLVAGPVVVHHGGVVDLSGESPRPHDSSITLPSLDLDVRRVGGAFIPVPVNTARGTGGPGGGDGGFGGDRFDFGPAPAMLDSASFYPSSDARDLSGFPIDPSGRPGEGIGGGRGPGGGAGGAPVSVPYPSNPSTLPEVSGSGVAFNITTVSGDDICLARQVGGAGSGGGYATAGSRGLSQPGVSQSDYPIGLPNGSAPTPGGRLPDGFLGPPGDDSPARQLGGAGNEYLRGGAGGGGGGSHCYQTRAGGLDGDGSNACIGAGSPFVEWHDHSGAPGGGGGGACALSSGVSIQIDGILDASGGSGGGHGTESVGGFPLPGGGGSGGALRIQAPRVRLGLAAGRIDVSGGDGGSFPGEAGVRGGSGGTGLVRIEDRKGSLDRHILARAILPFDPIDDSLAWLSVGSGAWVPDAEWPDPTSSATSCWIRPEGLFYSLAFQGDRGNRPETQGWNMELEWDSGAGPVRAPFRGDNPWYPVSVEDFLGNLVGQDGSGGGSPVAVRFQGARARLVGTRFCERALDGTNRAVQEGSVTPWVAHPEELNRFEPRPDMVRFMILFDPTSSGWAADGRTLRGVKRLWIGARPE